MGKGVKGLADGRRKGVQNSSDGAAGVVGSPPRLTRMPWTDHPRGNPLRHHRISKTFLCRNKREDEVVNYLQRDLKSYWGTAGEHWKA